MRAELIAFALSTLGVATAQGAQTIALKGDLQASADVLTASFRSDSVELSGNVNFVQGPNSITADRATGSDTRSDQSNWTFQGGVHIQTAEADLKSNTALATFDKGTISSAKIQGAPALFEQRGVPADQQVRGRANVIEYDFKAGIVTMSEQVWFSHGREQEISGGKVIYNIRDETVRVNAEGQPSGRVKGVIRPHPKGGNTGANTSDTSSQAQVASETGS